MYIEDSDYLYVSVLFITIVFLLKILIKSFNILFTYLIRWQNLLLYFVFFGVKSACNADEYQSGIKNTYRTNMKSM